MKLFSLKVDYEAKIVDNGSSEIIGGYFVSAKYKR